jgi:hypothetical protein
MIVRSRSRSFRVRYFVRSKESLQLYCIKAKAFPLHTSEALGGEELQPLLILDLGTRWDE